MVRKGAQHSQKLRSFQESSATEITWILEFEIKVDVTDKDTHQVHHATAKTTASHRTNQHNHQCSSLCRALRRLHMSPCRQRGSPAWIHSHARALFASAYTHRYKRTPRTKPHSYPPPSFASHTHTLPFSACCCASVCLVHTYVWSVCYCLGGGGKAKQRGATQKTCTTSTSRLLTFRLAEC